MDSPLFKNIISFALGLIAALIIIYLFERINHHYFPLPEGEDWAEHSVMVKYITGLPNNSLILILAGWLLGSFTCGLIIRKVSGTRKKTGAYIAGLLLMTAGIVDMFLIPHPTWFVVIGLSIFIPGTLLGHALPKNP